MQKEIHKRGKKEEEKMEHWNFSFVDGDYSSNFISPFHNFDHFSGNQDNKCLSSGIMVDAQQGLLHCPLTMVECGYGEENNNIKQEKKKKMTSKQIKLLERRFQEEIKLEPNRKMKLPKELGLQPRQIAVWFQNRKARWKNKQLEHLYESLRQEFEAVSREKMLLQEERERFKQEEENLGKRLQRGNGSSVSIQLDANNVPKLSVENTKLR